MLQAAGRPGGSALGPAGRGPNAAGLGAVGAAGASAAASGMARGAHMDQRLPPSANLTAKDGDWQTVGGTR